MFLIKYIEFLKRITIIYKFSIKKKIMLSLALKVAIPPMGLRYALVNYLQIELCI